MEKKIMKALPKLSDRLSFIFNSNKEIKNNVTDKSDSKVRKKRSKEMKQMKTVKTMKDGCGFA